MRAEDKNYTAKMARGHLSECGLCGHACGANRLADETGLCKAGVRARVSAALLHFGEEPPISGRHGSGTIFFSGCSLKCVYCQNYQISQQGEGREISDLELAEIMLDLAGQGARNINLVSPTPWVPQILSALSQAREHGLTLPIVYNTGGFDSLTALALLDGYIDVYLPDIKYMDEGTASRYSGARSYPAINQAAIREMVRQAGHLKFDASEEMAVRGVLVRHLVLPDNKAQTKRALTWLAGEFGPDVHLSLMSQYLPMYRTVTEAEKFLELSRPLTIEEYETAIDQALGLDLENVFIQELSSSETYVPDFKSTEVFQYTGQTY